jgi:hypothetical protein
MNKFFLLNVILFYYRVREYLNTSNTDNGDCKQNSILKFLVNRKPPSYEDFTRENIRYFEQIT